MFIYDLIKIQYSRQGYLPNYPYHLISDAEMFDAFLSFFVSIPEEDARKIKIGDSSLWESPNEYVRQYQLRSFEVVSDSENIQYLQLYGNRSKLMECMSLIGFTSTTDMNPMCFFAMNYPMEYESLSDSYQSLIDALCFHIDKAVNFTSYVLPDWVMSYMSQKVISNQASTSQERHDLLVLMNLDNLADELTEEVMQYCLKVSKEWIAKLPPAQREMRPPTMFGEPHVIKSLRTIGILNQL